MNKTGELLSYYRLVNDINHTKRKGWEDREASINGVTGTIGTHSYGAAMLAWVIAKEHGLNQEKIMKMKLIHDLIMALIQDVRPSDKEYETKRERENACAEALFEKVPESIRAEFKMLFWEYQDEQTEDAKIAREIDKLETLYQAYMYAESKGRAFIHIFLLSYREKFISKLGKQLFEELEELTESLPN